MSVVGIDFGNQYSVVALAQKGKVDIVVNEVSNRKTPTVVGYGDEDRQVGERGLSSQKSNSKRTVSEIKRLIGHRFSDAQVQAELKNFHFDVQPTDDDGIRVVVRTNHGEHRLSPEQITGAMFAKLKQMVDSHTGARMSDVVISCPPYFTQFERQAVLDAARIANLSVLRLMNETTAIALNYGILRPLPKDEAMKVMFVDVGHAATNVSLVAFQQGELQVLGTASDRSLGGRDYDLALALHFAKEFQAKYNIDPLSKAKPFLRLRAASQKTKHVLSANKDASIHIECLMNDVDVSGSIKRDDFSVYTQHVTDRLLTPIKQVLADAQTSPEGVHSIELVGGGVRVPAIRETLTNFFNKSLSTTLNGDEAVARGCALQCAMLSPAFRVRQFQVKDVSPYPIELCWGPVTANYKEATCQFEDKTPLFSKFNLIPSVKMIQFTKSEPFQLVLRYLDASQISGSPFISRAVITPPPVPADALSHPRIKVQIELSLHGLVGIKSVRLYEEIKEPEPAPAPDGKEAKTDAAAPMEDDPKAAKDSAETPAPETPSAEAAMEDDGADGEDAMDTSKDGDKDKPKKKKKKYKKTDLQPQTDYGFIMTEDEFKAAYEQEVAMANQDRIVEETAARRNELESYVYDTRAKLDYDWKDFIGEQACADFRVKLEETENWLYEDEGYNAAKSVYVQRTTELRKLGDPIQLRKWEAEHRQEAVDVLKSAVVQYQSFLMDAQEHEEKYAHVTAEERAKVQDESTKTDQWLTECLVKQDKHPTFEDPVFKVADCRTKLDALNKACYSIMTKPKPAKKKEEPKPAAAAADAEPAKADENMTDDSAEKPEKAASADEPQKEEAPAQENGTSQEVPMQD